VKTIRQILPVVIALILICVAMSILSPNFLTASNLTNVLMQASINAVLAAGMTFVILTAGIDLSVGSVVAFVGIILGFSLHSGMPMVCALLVALLAGGACGLFNGLLITKGKLPPFIVTLGMMSIARGLALILNNGKPVSSFDDSFRFIADGNIFGIPVMILITILVFVISFIILRHTPFGRYVYSIGGNEEATRLSGINTKKVLVWVYVICGLLAGLAAIMLTARINSAQPTAGLMYELQAIAATVIGGTSLMGGSGFVCGTLVGALIISVIKNGLNLLNVSSFLQQIVIGSVIILAVLVDSFRNNSTFNLITLLRKHIIYVIIAALLFTGCVVYTGISFIMDDDKEKIAFIMKTLNNPYFISMETGAKKEVNKHPEYKLLVQAPERETDVETQMHMVENMITRKVKAICITPSAQKDILSAIKKANKANIPVIIIDSNIDDELAKRMQVHYASFIGSDNYDGGALAAKYIAQMIGYNGEVAVIEGMPGAQANEQRKSGFLDTIKEYPGIKVVAIQPADFEREKGYAVAENILQAKPNLKGIFACSDLMALGAMEAIKQAKKEGKIFIIGFDALDETQKEIMTGRITASVAQFPDKMGKMAIDSAIKVIEGDSVPHKQNIEIELITKEYLLEHGKTTDSD